MRPESARQDGGNRLFEEQPDVSAAARSRSFEGAGKAQTSAAVQKRHGICLPSCLVEIDGEEVAGLIQEQRVDASDERLTLSHLARTDASGPRRR